MTDPSTNAPTADALCGAKCVPCEGGVPSLDRDAATDYLNATPDWSLNDEATAIKRKINGKNFVSVIAFVNQIAELAETEQHHPDLHVTGYRHLTVELTTHAIGGLSENDFIVAAKIDRLLAEHSK